MKVEMAADFVDNNSNSNSRRVAAKSAGGGQVQGQGQEQEQLPCPRCDSINTKFCYYNNYNFSQPRHFCKACRRYWTQGGTLRDIPVGGGTRKNAKRSRTAHVTTAITTTSAAATSSTAASVNMGVHQDYPLHATPVLMPFQGSSTGQFCGGDLKGTNNGNVGLCGSGGFTSLLSTQGPGFLALSGFGLGLGSNFVGDVGLSGLGRGVWGFAGMGDSDGGAVAAGVGSNSTGSAGGGASGIGNTWQFESGEATTSGFVGGDCFSWPDLAISTPGNGLK